jgi:adenylate cyclase
MSGETPESGEGPAPTGPPMTVQPPPGGTGGGAPRASGHLHAHHSAIQFRFLEQLKHRNIIRVGILYLVACWLILDPVHVVFHMLEVPPWANRLVVILMAIGFPVVLLFAWVYEITPEGLKPTADVDPHRSIRKLTARRLDRAIMVVLLLAIAYLLVDKFWLSGHTTKVEHEAATSSPVTAPAATVVSEKSIAVLPFTDMSEKKDQEYFGDGMAEEILDLLAKIPGLTVIGRTSSFQFKGKDVDLRTIGTQLNAAHVLEGSIRKSGDQVRITAQLINTRTGTHEWSDTYDRHIGDVLKLQDAIAAVVVRELQLTVSPEFLQSRATLRNADAYDLMLRGRHAADRFDKEGLDEAVTLFRQALDRDPTSADAAAELASAYYDQESYLSLPGAAEQARRAAAVALKLDPTNELAHSTLGAIYLAYDWDWAAAEREYHQTATIAPGSADVLNSTAWLSLVLGRWDDALRQIKAALAQDPLDPNSFEALTWVQMARGHLAEAEAAMRRGLEIRPTYTWGHFILGLVLLARGERDAALLEMQQETSDEARQAGLAMTYYSLGRKTASDASLASMLKDQGAENAFEIANVYAFRGQSDEATHWLERAYVQKDTNLFLVKSYLPLQGLAADPRFKAFLRKMKLPG